MLQKLRNYFRENKNQNITIISQNNKIILQNQELIWSQIFHDAIRGHSKLESLPLNIGRWAGNYSFFYILYRILKDFRPSKILELGLGESSKFISTFIEFYMQESKHLIIEQDEKWKHHFVKGFNLSNQSEIKVFPTVLEKVKGVEIEVYSSLDEIIQEEFDFYLIDGPKGNEYYSRYDAFKIVQNLKEGQDFIILIDDYDREGEQATVSIIIEELRNRKIPFNSAVYTGLKKVIVISSDKYKAVKGF